MHRPAPKNSPGGTFWGSKPVLTRWKGGPKLASQRKIDTKTEPKKRRPPARTPEARENQLIGLSVDLAERQLRDGTASAQVITHFLKLGTTREKLEQEMLRENVELQRAKREAMASAARVEELYGAAIDAMRTYAGHGPMNGSDDVED